MKEKRIQIIIHEKWAGQTLQDLFKITWNAPKKLVHQIRMEKGALVNGVPLNWLDPLKSGDLIELIIKDTNPLELTPIPINILYEDDHILIVNKPAQITTHPNEKENNTLANAVAYYLNGEYGEYIHRLDKDTTGAILFAKHPLIKAILDQMLKERKIKRTYWALADGLVETSKGIIDQPIGRDRHHPTKRRVSKTGKKAVTKFHVLKKWQKDQLTLVECTLETGRTHQIRVHFNYIGHPLAGDRQYGGSSKFHRQALHARKLSFVHPFTLQPISVEAPFLDKPEIFNEYVN